MKHVHFFGCSFTAGDELSDEKWFPWKFTEEHTYKTYYDKRAIILSKDDLANTYTEENKKFAYPALMNSGEIKTHNHAINGASIRTNIFRIVELFCSGAPIDAIYFQIPPVGRELYLLSGDVTSIQMAVRNADHKWDNYIAEKLISHEPAQWALEDFLDLQLISAYAKERKVPLTFLVFESEIKYRYDDLSSLPNFKFLTDEYEKLNVMYVQDVLSQRGHRLLGHHYSHVSHQDLADYLANHLHTILKSK